MIGRYFYQIQEEKKMAYYNLEETKRRVEKVRGILREKNLDCAIIYYDELNVADGWYLTGWCPQFEKEAVMVFANEAGQAAGTFPIFLDFFLHPCYNNFLSASGGQETRPPFLFVYSCQE